MERLLRILSSLVLLPQTAMVLLWSHLYALVLRFWDCRVPHFVLGINPWLWEVNPLLFLPIWNFYLCMDIFVFVFLRRAMWHFVKKNRNRMERQILLLETPNTPQNVNRYFCFFCTSSELFENVIYAWVYSAVLMGLLLPLKLFLHWQGNYSFLK